MPNETLAPITDLIPGLPDSARLWIFGVGRPLSHSEEEHLLAKVDEFLETWRAHGSSLAAARDWRYERFLLVGVDERVAPPSGCSIDALVRVLSEIESELDVEIVGSEPVWYRTEGPKGEIARSSRSEFRERARQGNISVETIVFDLSVTRLGEAREGRWELPAGQSWHRRLVRS